MTTLSLRLWQDDDLPLLHRANTPAMTSHLNGPESPQQIDDRHTRYLRYLKTGEARMFVVLLGTDPVGSIGYWKVSWHGEPAWETGWFVLPEAQGQGIAAQGLALLIEDLRAHDDGRRFLVAFPGADNPASNAVCRRAGFRLVGSTTEVFREQQLAINEWVLDLAHEDTGQDAKGPSLR
ncbi:GNAT family N-acetyltransferase [Microbacterium sp. W4I20]|uniref:GNAT family N-acetyltransferase n=1 Tax=Microbacterium sp. W4I20 TaxID=3042262 RepID=UPI002788129B|nr:GNAT family N-acetyltransferase [Microbacterium sp. W4I20]MDQ0725708.1 RimJ/RimL family protein N-acetyltransferase [Microbacterium sp. W4I20]